MRIQVVGSESPALSGIARRVQLVWATKGDALKGDSAQEEFETSGGHSPLWKSLAPAPLEGGEPARTLSTVHMHVRFYISSFGWVLPAC